MNARAVIDLSGTKLYLASKSPRRAALFELMGFDFDVVDSAVDEKEEKYSYPEVHVLELALKKAMNVAERLKEGYVVGADTIVVLDELVLEKPESASDAVRMLKKLSGRTHMVYTGYAIVDASTKRAVSDYEKTAVTFRELNDTEIERYVTVDKPFDKAGAYGIQDQSAIFVEAINGCFYNVVGFPVTKFYQTMTTFDADQNNG